MVWSPGQALLDDPSRHSHGDRAGGDVAEHHAESADLRSPADPHAAEHLRVGPQLDVVLDDRNRAVINTVADRNSMTKCAVGSDLGVGMDELPGPDAKALKIDDGAVLVKTVESGTAAEKAGIKAGDIILRINKEALNRQKAIRHVRQIVADLEPGSEIIVEVLRGEERLQLVVTVGKRPAHLP